MSTKDCKEFLAEFFKRNPVIPGFFGSAAEGDPILKDAQTPKKWKRRYKCKPGGGDYEFRDYTLYTEGCAVNRWGDPVPIVKAKLSDYVSERAFDLDDTEGQIAFLVLEKTDGSFDLGDYIGD